MKLRRDANGKLVGVRPEMQMKAGTEAKPDPRDPPDPRDTLTRNIPPYGAA